MNNYEEFENAVNSNGASDIVACWQECGELFSAGREVCLGRKLCKDVAIMTANDFLTYFKHEKCFNEENFLRLYELKKSKLKKKLYVFEEDNIKMKQKAESEGFEKELQKDGSFLSCGNIKYATAESVVVSSQSCVVTFWLEGDNLVRFNIFIMSICICGLSFMCI